MLWQRWVRVVYEVKRHLGEPSACGRIDQAPFGINRCASRSETSCTLAIRLSRNFHPEVSIKQRDAGIRRWTHTQATIWRVAPILRIWIRGGRSPRPLTVPARVNDKMFQPSIPGVRHPGLILNIIGIPLIREGPSGEIIWACRRILASAPFEVASTPRTRTGITKPNALRDPSAILL